MTGSLTRFFYLVVLIFMVVFFVYPLVRVIQGGFFDEGGVFTLSFLLEVFKNPIYSEGLLNSLKVATTTTCLVFLLAIPLAVLNARYTFPGKSFLSSLVLAPMILPPFVGALGLRQFWGQYGVLNAILSFWGYQPEQPIDWLGISQFWGVVSALSLNLYPILYLNATAALANVDPAMEEAAKNLGARFLRRFIKITLV